jgi:hypothetical protein
MITLLLLLICLILLPIALRALWVVRVPVGIAFAVFAVLTAGVLIWSYSLRGPSQAELNAKYAPLPTYNASSLPKIEKEIEQSSLKQANEYWKKADKSFQQ